jgi:hypothetical protein
LGKRCGEKWEPKETLQKGEEEEDIDITRII